MDIWLGIKHVRARILLSWLYMRNRLDWSSIASQSDWAVWLLLWAQVEDRLYGFFFSIWNRGGLSHCGPSRRHLWPQANLQAGSVHALGLFDLHLLPQDQQPVHPVWTAPLFWNEYDCTLLRRLFLQHRNATEIAPASREHDPILVWIVCLLFRMHLLYLYQQKLDLPLDSKHQLHSSRSFVPLLDAWNPTVFAKSEQILVSEDRFC